MLNGNLLQLVGCEKTQRRILISMLLVITLLEKALNILLNWAPRVVCCQFRIQLQRGLLICPFWSCILEWTILLKKNYSHYFLERAAEIIVSVQVLSISLSVVPYLYDIDFCLLLEYVSMDYHQMLAGNSAHFWPNIIANESSGGKRIRKLILTRLDGLSEMNRPHL